MEAQALNDLTCIMNILGLKANEFLKNNEKDHSMKVVNTTLNSKGKNNKVELNLEMLTMPPLFTVLFGELTKQLIERQDVAIAAVKEHYEKKLEAKDEKIDELETDIITLYELQAGPALMVLLLTPFK